LLKLQQDPYTTLKTELAKRLCPSRHQRTRQLFTLEEMGDRKPSQFLRSLAPDIPDNYLRILWTRRLPTNIQTRPDVYPPTSKPFWPVCLKSSWMPWPSAQIASWRPSALASTSPGPDYMGLLQSIHDLPRQLVNLITELNHPNS
jgi:hypothetical protein